MILGEGLKLSLMGMGVGLVGALWAGDLVSSLLAGLSPWDPLTLSVVCLLLLSVSAAACSLPAWRAMRIEAVSALRGD